jgi:hypothetical protein
MALEWLVHQSTIVSMRWPNCWFFWNSLHMRKVLGFEFSMMAS